MKKTLLKLILITTLVGIIFWFFFILSIAFAEDGNNFYSWIAFAIAFITLPLTLIFRIRIKKIIKKCLLFIRKNYKKISIFIFLVVVIVLTYNLLNYYKIANMCIITVSWQDENFFDKLNEGYEKTLYLDDDFYLNHCETDDYDCNDFCSQDDAQKVFNECYDMGGTGKEPIRDINNLDKDNDGTPCESLR